MDHKWKKKFDEAEVTPNSRVWDKIAADLDATTPAAGASFPRYWAWAAAVALFAMSGILAWVFTGENAQDELALTSPSMIESTPQKDPTKQTTGQVETFDKPEISNSFNSSENLQKTYPITSTLAEKRPVSQPTKKITTASNIANTPQENVAVIESEDQLFENETLATTNATEEGLDEIQQPSAVEVKPGASKAEKFEYPEAEDFLIERKKSSSNDNRMWVGVAQGVGSYSSQMSGGNMAIVSDFAPFTLERAMAELQTDERGISEQIALTTGIFVGVPVANNLSIVTGLTYNKSNFTSTAVDMNGELLHFTSDLVKVKNEISSATYSTVDVQGSYEMALLPVLADVAILSGNLSWSMQAGPELGLLMRQQVTSDQSGTSRTTRPGDVYHPFHLRVALGSTLSYDVSDTFQVSFQPIVEQAVTSITTEDASFKSYPMNYSALFGVRYKFN